MTIENERSQCDYCKRIDGRKKIEIHSPRFDDDDGPLLLHPNCNEALMFYGLLLRSSSIKDGHKLVNLANRLAGVQIKTRKVEN